MTLENQTEKKLPTHFVYFLTDKKGSEQKDWNKTGACWLHEDNNGMNVSLEVFGQKVSLVIRKSKPKE
ncbi:hypothetical protein LZD49_18375 [Dyadobacter sp. CY261]|uniref:hypothetical protein n=1 Tax=Dyadobacter sp. CY261 TaxID=2907203 RepID=UPI001F424061|nr:hypothetical protein [Dyadobacter sp. CY261]MCF0072455.1 hypothetical protein [Dyadobacter sp. CY261]